MEQETYDKIKFVLGENELFLSEEEIDLVIKLALQERTNSEHVGVRPKRCDDNPREKAFMEHWLKENKIDPRLNSGQGILQGLFIEDTDPMAVIPRKTYMIEISKREREIVATVIQWLGSNCGWAFLLETLRDIGYTITKIEK